MLLRFFLCALLSFISAAVIADDCGQPPQSPSIIDGNTATMEELVVNNESVKSFIATADKFLDCREMWRGSEGFSALADAGKKNFVAENKTLLDARNDIAEDFNDQVLAFKKANP